MSKLMVKVDDIWVPMEGLKGDTGPLPADETIPDTALVTDGAKTNTAYLMRNRLTKDAEGTLISVEDAYAVPPVSLSADGVSTQVSTTGKNWFDRDNAPNGYYDGSTGAFGASSITKWASIPVEEGDVIYWADMPNNYPSGWSNGEFVQLTASRPSSPITVPAGVDEVRVYATNSTANSIVTKNNSDLTPEPYTGLKPAPSPDYPQEITGVDELAVTFAGKNLFDIAKVIRTSENVTVEGTTITTVGTSRDIFTGKVGASAAVSDLSTVMYLPAGTYTVSCGKIAGSFVSLKLVADDGTVSNLISASRGSTTWVGTFTLNTATHITIRATNQVVTNLQIETGPTATTYQPYSGVTAALDLSEEPLRSLPDGTKDELHLTYIRPSTRPGWAYYKGEKVKRVGYVDMGTLGWMFAYKGQNYEKFWVKVDDMARPSGYDIRIISENYRGFNNGNTYVLMPDYSIAMRSDTGYMSVKDPRFETAADFKVAVSGVMAYYPLATPETLDLGIFELPAMQSGTTNLWSDPSTNLSVTYERDRNIVITNLKAAVADLTTS